MLDGPAAQLAVARLTEAGAAARKYRHDPARPLEGYCLVTGDQQHCRVTIYVENGRTLADRRPGGDFYYEGWVVGHPEPISIGAFNTGASGEGSGTCTREAGLLGLGSAAAIRVTAEPLGGSPSGATPVLEGRLIWLHGEPKPAPLAAAAPAQDAAAKPTEDAALARAQDAAVSASLPLQGAVQVDQPAEQDLTPDQPADFAAILAQKAHDPSLQPVPAAAETALREPEAAPTAPPLASLPDLQVDSPEREATVQASTAVPSPEEASEPPAPEAEPPEPAPPFALRPATRTITLESCHPMAPRAVGSAVLHLQEGRITATLRGLPSPVALGRTPGLNRPFNGYRLWLVSQRSGSRLPLGALTRVWGENYRVEEGPGLPLARYDTLLITADDRTAASPDPHWPHVMTGSLEPGGA